MGFTVIYDACVLYPAPLRDFLMRLALTGLFRARWTDQIRDEWTRSLLRNRPELEDTLPRTVELMNHAMPDSLVTGHERLIGGLSLPDPDDRHVLAAAIVSGAQLIITFNTRDFPEDELAPYGIEAVHPDTFSVQQPERVSKHSVNRWEILRSPFSAPPPSSPPPPDPPPAAHPVSPHPASAR